MGLVESILNGLANHPAFREAAGALRSILVVMVHVQSHVCSDGQSCAKLHAAKELIDSHVDKAKGSVEP